VAGIIIVVVGLIIIQLAHTLGDLLYKHKLETDPKFRLLEETKNYRNCWIKYEPNVWLDSESAGTIKFIGFDIGNERVIGEDFVDSPLVRKIIKAKAIEGFELKECRECGALSFERRYPPDWSGFCKNKNCAGKCYERDLRHLARIYNVKNESIDLFNGPRENLKDRCKFCHDMVTARIKYAHFDNLEEYQDIKCAICKGKIDSSKYDEVPMYETAKRQNFSCTICNGKMNHIWNNNYSGNNYLYHTIDHIKPVSFGGTHQIDNIQIVHFICNMVKGTGPNIKLDIEAKDFLADNPSLMDNEDLLIAEFKNHIIVNP
jgi:5-methylcytosine-specific restriction endonuclease McrA